MLILLQQEKKSVYVCIIMEIIVVCLPMAQKLFKFKAKDTEIVANSLCLGNISEDFSSANMKKKLDCVVLFLTLVSITE